MKKIMLSFMVAVFSLSMYSCRETTQEKTEDALEAIGEDVEDGTRRAADKVKEGADKVKEGAEKVGREIDEEIHETNDQVEHNN